MSLYDEPRQSPQSQHILTDDRSKAWVEVPDAKADEYPALVSSAVTWVAFSALAYKLVKLLTTVVAAHYIVLYLGLLLLPLAYVLYKRSQDENTRFSTLVWLTVVVLGIVIGGL